MCELNFITKKTVKKVPGKAKPAWDVMVRASKRRAGGGVNFTFRNHCQDLIAPSSNRIAYAVSGSRIYFTQNEDGWHLQSSNKGPVENRYLCISGHDELTEWADRNGGKFMLLHDTEKGLYCIDANGAATANISLFDFELEEPKEA